MKIQVSFITAALVLAGCSDKTASDAPAPSPPPPQAAAAPSPAPAAAPAEAPKSPEEAARAKEIEQAESFTQEQIGQSRNPDALAKLAMLYEAQEDRQRDIWTLEQLTKLLPNSGELRLKLAAAYAATDDKTHVYDTLLRLINLGFSYDLGKDPRFESAHGTRVWDYIVSKNEENAKAVGEGKVAFELPKGDTLFESIGWDPKRKEFLVGSVREGKIYRADEHGKLTDFIAPDAGNGVLAVFGMAVDAANDKLYVISNGVPHFDKFSADMVGKAVLSEFTLSSGKFLHKYTLPADTGAHILSSIAADDKGHVYVADGVNQEIYRVDGGALKLVTKNPVLNGIRGMAVSGDGRTLYFADIALGIFGLDLATGKPFTLGYNPEHLALGGIDGLYWYNGTLVAVQNAVSPIRVIRLKLDPDGRNVTNVVPLDVAQPAFKLPTIGVVADDGLYFIANSQKGLYSDLGVLTDADKLEPVRIFRSNLRYAWNQEGTKTGKPTPPNVPPLAPELLRAPPKGVVQPAAAAPAPAMPPAADTKQP